MANNLSNNVQKTTGVGKATVTGAIIGGMAGAVAGIFDEIGLLVIPKLLPAYSPIIAGAALGIIIGGGIGAVVGYASPKEVENHELTGTISGASFAPETNQDLNNGEFNLKIREEQLDIAKKEVQTGEITVHKEIHKEDKNLVIPVIREELIIEKKLVDDTSSERGKLVETIRIPVSEERIEVTKQPVILNNVSINKHKIHEIKRVDEILKKEKVHLEVIGKAKIKDTDNGH